MIHQFDHRWAAYESDGKTSRDVTGDEKRNPTFEPLPRYWVPENEVDARLSAKGWTRGWLMGWRRNARSTDDRTMIAGVFPESGVGDSAFLFRSSCQSPATAALIGALDSLVLDFIARQKVGGVNMSFYFIEQFPVVHPDALSDRELAFITPRVLELTYTSHSMAPFARDLGYVGPPFPWDDDRRALLRAELDAFYARAYGLTRDELRYILDPADVKGHDYPSETFRVLKNNEMKHYAEYRTARLVLDAWDRMEGGELK
jgi:hypothetical protein